MLRLFLLISVLLPATPLFGAQAVQPDSVRILGEARNALRSHIRELRSMRYSAPGEEAFREVRREVLQVMDRAGGQIPGDDWIVGHRVGLRVLQGEMDEALLVAERCAGSGWWCDALRGFVLHVRGETVDAETAFDASLREMPSERRCDWLSEIPRFLLEGDYARSFRRMSCDEQIDEERRLWWLANPLYLVPGNDRRTEHYARLVAMEMHHRWLDLENDRCYPSHHEAEIRQGWPAWWWSVEETITSLGDGSGYRFIPRDGAALEPFESDAADWSIDPARYGEWYDPSWGPVLALDPQVAFFRRDDRFLVLAAADVPGLESAEVLAAGVVLSRGPGDLSLALPGESSSPSRIFFDAVLPQDDYLVSVELVAGYGAARGRTGHALPANPDGLDISDILLWDWDDETEQVVGAIGPRMIGRSRLHADQQIGIFWELYGATPGETIDVSISTRARGRGLLSRVTDFLRITSPPRALRFVWTEGMDAAGDAARGRSIALNLSQLPAGDYSIELRVSADGGDEVVRTRDIELYR